MTTIEDIPILEPSCTKVATTEFSKLEPFLVENFPQNLEKVVDTLLLNNTIGFHLSVLEAYRYFNIKITDWEKIDSLLERTVSFSVNVNAPIIGKREVQISQDQFLFKENDTFVLEIHSVSKGIPFSDVFTAHIRLRFCSTDATQSKIELSNFCKFNRFLPVKKTIERGAQASNEEFFKNWFLRAHDTLEGRKSDRYVDSEYADKEKLNENESTNEPAQQHADSDNVQKDFKHCKESKKNRDTRKKRSADDNVSSERQYRKTKKQKKIQHVINKEKLLFAFTSIVFLVILIHIFFDHKNIKSENYTPVSVTYLFGFLLFFGLGFGLSFVQKKHFDLSAAASEGQNFQQQQKSDAHFSPFKSAPKCEHYSKWLINE